MTTDTITLDRYRDRLRALLTEDDSAEHREQVKADAAWVGHAVANYDPDPMVMAFDLANQINMRAIHDPRKKLADDHTRAFQASARKGKHYIP